MPSLGERSIILKTDVENASVLGKGAPVSGREGTPEHTLQSLGSLVLAVQEEPGLWDHCQHWGTQGDSLTSPRTCKAETEVCLQKVSRAAEAPRARTTRHHRPGCSWAESRCDHLGATSCQQAGSQETRPDQQVPSSLCLSVSTSGAAASLCDRSPVLHLLEGMLVDIVQHLHIKRTSSMSTPSRMPLISLVMTGKYRILVWEPG